MSESSFPIGHHPEYVAAVNELATIVLGEESLTESLRRVAGLARRVLPEVDEVSVTLVEQDRPKTVVFTGELAARLDERQYQRGFGPCVDAAISGETIVVTAAGDTAYPDFASACRRSAVTHTISVGFPIPHRVVGALNLYLSTAAVDAETVAMAQTFASYAGIAVANAALHSNRADLAEQLRAAMRTRAVIEQAKGVLMAQHGFSAEEAFQALATMSQTTNRKLHDVAQRLVDQTFTIGRPDRDPSGE